MDLDNQEKLYALPAYYLLLIIGDDDVCGIISSDNAEKINVRDLQDCGFYLKKINLGELYSQGLDILKDEQLI